MTFARRLMLDFDGRRLQGARPFATFEATNGAWSWHGLQTPAVTDGRGDALQEVARGLKWARQFGISGAAVGFVSYDLARQIEPRAFASTSRPDDLQIPDIRLDFCHELQELEAHQGESEAQPIVASADTDDSDYLDGVRRIQEFIAAGDIYQANLTRRFSRPLLVSPHQLYAQLRARHPMPFSALLEWDDLAVVSNSPERFLSLRDGVLLAQPIKGTLRRGKDADEDARLKAQLQTSLKDRAENVMIVDLLRNDLGRVCETGSVCVPELFAVQSFPSLYHLVSSVHGTLKPELSGVDAFRACFPCGSITGAPKIRAMQILDEMEPVRRGVSMGAIGYFGFDGGVEWNVAIRTVTCVGGTAYFHVGGGIVADSEPQSEADEMRLKARALFTALESSSVKP